MNKGRETKPHIGVFGRCNVGKSTLINKLVGQEISIVSTQAGTTTDSVKKTMEIKGIGAVVLIDTAGIDDNSILGQKRIEKALEVFAQIDLALIAFNNDFGHEEDKLIEECNKFNIPYVLIYTKSDLAQIRKDLKATIEKKYNQKIVEFSQDNSKTTASLTKEIQATIPPTAYQTKGILTGLIKKNSVVLLVTPIDSSAPEGRMILPQVQLIRDVLDNQAINIVVKESELEYTLKNIYPNPDLVITDSQVFDYVNSIVDEKIPLTSFSIVLARLKGSFDYYVKGTPKLDDLKDGDRILMLESCSHQPTCEDIGRVKLPKWISDYSKKKLEFETVAGLSPFPRPINEYAMVIQCGGCVATQKQLKSRLLPIIEANIPVSNYGIAIAYMNGIFKRATKMFNK
ncbi:MAG: [FeFe] hydrogenase H-cluster maturation GTPase HydF [Bacteroidales bacterium]|nr:[FeFe] hydrogenase H-cluster maturation GTPase HydF [Bacteroidales bacterium]MDD4002259.1 [FeFe] hydrogenase H-cluster maturation GTPase HydF [Bacteroidales bacterium]MDD4529235.1 [FeFe] hydrogenase H-cluster maturation GTPase HydF [Bacteroidales bacterium]MDD4829306.1 [FeFe] hydrogenase H-cluster maturation GTPase HydF [Bacteroidales bacterium]